MRLGHESPKKPPSYSAWCQAAWPSQYSSDVDDVGRPGSLSRSHARRRARKAASSGEPPKSTSTSSAALVGEDAVEAGPHAAEQLGRDEGAPQVHVRQALPRVADAAVHLDGRLADRAGSAG